MEKEQHVEQKKTERDIFWENPPLTQRQIRAIPFFVFARNVEEGCRKSGVSRNAYYRWVKNEIFREEFNRVREGILREAIGRLQLSINRAVDVMGDLLEINDDSIKLRAAEKIIDNFFRIKETKELEVRIEKIEEIIFNQGAHE